MTGLVTFAKAISPAVSTFSQLAGTFATVGTLFGDTSVPEISYSPLPTIPETTEAEPEVPAVATTAVETEQTEITREEEARLRALRRKKINVEQLTMLTEKDSSTSSVLTKSLFGG